jgi:hypothetical protein
MRENVLSQGGKQPRRRKVIEAAAEYMANKAHREARRG